MAEIIALLAAFASAIATSFAAMAAWKAPKSAAELAEKLRRSYEEAQDKHRQKFQVFAVLMQERSAIYNENAVRMLNVIDVVFHDARKVREAWADLYLAFNNQAIMQGPGHEEKLRQLLSAMAEDIGLGDQFGTADLGRVYIPTALQQERMIRDLERKNSLDRLQGNAAPSANTIAQKPALFPPAPT